MNTKWLVADVTAVGSPDRAERDILGIILDNFLTNLGLTCGGWGALFDAGIYPLLSPNNFK